jgi:small-conductance mechanosensitive channel
VLRLVDRAHAEAERQSSQFSIAALASSAAAGLRNAWEYEIASVDDRPITVKKVVLAALLFLAGLLLSYRLSAILSRKLLPRFKLLPGAAAAIESLAFYALMVTSAFVALTIVHIPLTVFTLLGGALAIAVGFGSQNILNNFISSLILLVEQPIRVGDVIEVDNLRGSVLHIGMRSTKIRTGENTDIIVPNSNFLAKSVINWTLSDSRVRTSVTVPVAYGSAVEKVKQILLEAAENHSEVIRVPTPFVWITSFGETALHFELHFWVDLRSFTDRAAIESEVRSQIIGRLAEEKIAVGGK